MFKIDNITIGSTVTAIRIGSSVRSSTSNLISLFSEALGNTRLRSLAEFGRSPQIPWSAEGVRWSTLYDCQWDMKVFQALKQGEKQGDEFLI